jgi:L-2-hydroxyglutarate oxidase LhgO
MERHGKFGQEASSRNSEIIHAGIYYSAGTLKARLCIEGNRMLYEFCSKWKVPHKRLGKLIVAREDDEIPPLERFFAKGRQNGVPDVQLLDRKQTATLEPHINAVAAILSPSTGIIDTHSLMSRLECMAKEQGAIIAYNHEVIGVEPGKNGYRVFYRRLGGLEDFIQCRWLINCAGLGGDRIASSLGIDIDEAGYRIFPCKGEYFSVRNSKAGLVTHLIYPLPLGNLKGLGIHTTKSLDGRLKLGPNAFYVDTIDYSVDPEHVSEFYSAAKTLLPFIEENDLQPDIAGIRAKIQPEMTLTTKLSDFIVRHEEDRGLEGVINVMGIESPGLTCCLSLAKYVGNMMEEIIA